MRLSHLPGFLGAELDERRSAEEESKHVSHDVIDHHHQDWQDEPDQACSEQDGIQNKGANLEGDKVTRCTELELKTIVSKFPEVRVPVV